MKLGDFPVEQTLEHRAKLAGSIFDDIDETCPEDRRFSSVTGMDPYISGKVDAFSRQFFAAHIDVFTPADSPYVAEPLHFGFHVARLLQDGAASLQVPDTAEWKITTETGGTIDARLMVDAYLRESYHLDSLIRAYMDRLCGIEAAGGDLIIEPAEVRHSRLLAGATFLLIDIANANNYHDEQIASDLRAIEEFEKQFGV